MQTDNDSYIDASVYMKCFDDTIDTNVTKCPKNSILLKFYDNPYPYY